MTTAFVLGNGVSRKEVDLERLKLRGAIYGCNGLYRDFTPTALVATDRPIAQRIQKEGYSAKHRFYTRKPISGMGGLPVPSKYHGYSSGPIAASLAAIDGHQRIYLIGYDMGPNTNGLFNNVYAGTEFYKAIGDSPTFTGNWIKQLSSIMCDFQDRQFVRVFGSTTQVIENLESVKNLSSMTMVDFLERLNTGKDF